MNTLIVALPEGVIVDYLGYLFPRNSAGEYVVSSSNDVGRMLIGYIIPVDHPQSPRQAGKGKIPVTLRLPDTDSTQHLRNKWLGIGVGNEARFASVVKAYFDIDLMGTYVTARAMGYQKKEALEMFCVSRNLVAVTDPYEALHKRIYRMEQQRMADIVRILNNKVSYFEKSRFVVSGNRVSDFEGSVFRKNFAKL